MVATNLGTFINQTDTNKHKIGTWAAAIDGVTIQLENIVPPKTDNHLIIEGAGGILVPLNETATIADLILPEYKVIVVSRPYLGSINHTLLTIKYLKDKGCDVAIIFSGKEHKTSEESIKTFAKVPVLGRIDEEPYFDKNVIKEYAENIREKL